MKTLLSVLAASAIAFSASSAFAMCGHESAKLEQTVASTSQPADEQEAMTTYDPKETVIKAEEEKAE